MMSAESPDCVNRWQVHEGWQNAGAAVHGGVNVTQDAVSQNRNSIAAATRFYETCDAVGTRAGQESKSGSESGIF